VTPPVDGRGRPLRLERPPERIVSLVPSTTETLFALGCGARVVGRTRFCVHPDAVAAIPTVGGTKDVDPDRVRALAPDLIVGNCEETSREIFDALDAVAPIWAAFPRDVDGALADLDAMGELTGERGAAAIHRAAIERARGALRAARGDRTFRYAYLIWREPWMAAGADTFIASMLAEAGGVNALAGWQGRFPPIDPTALGAADLDVVLLSSEPFPFRERHRAELAAASDLPLDRIRFVDGELMSWHGARMRLALPALERAIREGFPTAPVRPAGRRRSG